MDKIHHTRRTTNPGRRAFLGFTAAGLAVPLGAMAPASWRSGRSSAFDALSNPPICRVAAEVVAPGPTPREIRLCWNANSVCHTGIATADLHGYFARHNLKVERINFSGASDQLLELLASGKADAGVGMALGWLKPLEQGFDVKLTAALHGGCIRVLTNQQSGITDIAGLKGKTVGTFNMASPDRNFVSILAAKSGVDPLKDIDWRVYPADLLGVALQKGEIQAFSSNDPIASIVRDRDHLVEVTNNLAGDYANRACCVLGIRAGLVRDERPVAAALTAAIMEAQEWVAENSDAAGAVFAGYSKVGNAEQVAAMLRTHTHHHHPVGGALKQEIVLYAQELKQAGVFRPGTDPAQFADRVCVDVLAT
jgi:NitT/TauT family transport system substrate-binding protein